jgi:hypothetical protein
LSQIVEAVCVAVKREVEREMMRALLRLLSSFLPAPKYEQELGAFKEWYPLDQRQTTTAKNEWNVCYNMADTHTQIGFSYRNRQTK